jgi:hypothetical protein
MKNFLKKRKTLLLSIVVYNWISTLRTRESGVQSQPGLHSKILSGGERRGKGGGRKCLQKICLIKNWYL